MDRITPELRQYMNDEVTQVLHVLSENKIPYSVWGAAATEFHGGDWLWKCQDYEILIADGVDGHVLQEAIALITARCRSSWLYDHRFDEEVWATAKGDRPPRYPIQRFRHTRRPSPDGRAVGEKDKVDFGILLVPSLSAVVASVHADDLVDATTPADPAWVFPVLTHIPSDPVWVYPSLKNYIESQLHRWKYEGRNSALLELKDVIVARRFSLEWAVDLGLDVTKERTQASPEVPSEWEVLVELIRTSRSVADTRRVSARFRARVAERENRARAEAEGGVVVAAGVEGG